MTKKHICVLMLAAAVAACGGGSGSGEDSGEPQIANLSVSVAAPTASVPAGERQRLTIVVQNRGAADTADRSLQVELGSSLTAGPMSCSASAGARCPEQLGLHMTVPAMPSRAALTFELDVDVPSGLSGRFEGNVGIDATGDSLPSDNAATFSVTAYSANLFVVGNGPGEAVVEGGTATYGFSLSNEGPDAAADIRIEQSIDANQDVVDVRCRAAGGAICPQDLGPSMSVPAIAPGGSLAFDVVSTVKLGTVGTVSATMTVSSRGDPISGDNAATPSVMVQPLDSPVSVVELHSEAGDFIGQGYDYAYTKAWALMGVQPDAWGGIRVDVNGNQNWAGRFQPPTGQTRFQPATYSNVTQYGSGGPSMDWSGEGRGCNGLTGSFTVHDATYSGDVLVGLELSFEQHCEGDQPALFGHVLWSANDRTAPPGPVNPPPQGLWKPADGATPKDRNYVYLQSDQGDFIGDGRTYTYTQADAILTATAKGNHVEVRVFGDESWGGDFIAMFNVDPMRPGYYPGILRYPFHNQAIGGMDWWGQGRGCNRLYGWMTVDSIVMSGDTVDSIDLRFEQHCEGMLQALHGKVHWTSTDRTTPPGPVVPPPRSLWDAPAGSTPGSGNYVYLQSEQGEYVGQGQTFLYTPTNSGFAATTEGNYLSVVVDGAEHWVGDFKAMDTLASLQLGYYGSVKRYPFHNPTKGGLAWYGSRGCNEVDGWFVVDRIEYVGADVSAVDLRFEQRCRDLPDPNPPALHGKIHWTKP